MHTGIYIHPRKGKVYDNITKSMEVHAAILTQKQHGGNAACRHKNW